MAENQSEQDHEFNEACRFIIKLGLTAHAYGATADSLETYLAHVTEQLGYSGAFRSTPTEMMFAFQKKEGQWQHVHMATRLNADLDLDKLNQVGDLVAKFESEDRSIAEAYEHLDAISRRPNPWPRFASIMSFALVASGIAVLLDGSWMDVLVAAVISMIVYGTILLVESLAPLEIDWLPTVTAFVAAALATILKIWVPELNVVLVVLASIAVLIPGFTISIGIIELVTRHVDSGIVNLASGVVYLVKQAVGAWLGVSVILALFRVPSGGSAAPVADIWLAIFVPLLIVGLGVVFQIAPRDSVWAWVGCAIAYSGIALGGVLADPNLGNLMGSIFAAIYANLWTRWKKRPTSTVLLPAIVLLASGSIGFQGLAAIAAGETSVGLSQFGQMFFVALTIAAGLLVGNTIVRPKVSL